MASTCCPVEAQQATAASAEVGSLQAAVQRFIGWLDRVGYASFDPYDIWGTRYGLAARRLYYAKHPAGFLLTVPVLLMEILWPGLRGLWVRKDRYPTADAQLALAFLNLYRLGREVEHLERARALADDLLKSSIAGYHGHGWGYPFDWQHNKGLWERQTPYITATPYCYEVFVQLHEATGESRYLETAASITRFVELDLQDTPTGPESAAGSYSPLDHTKVINASAYRAFVLFDAAERFGRPACARKARRNLNFILETQRPDGSWLYGLDGPLDGFIDHFHTCFVLKNLFKLNRQLRDPAVDQAVRRGWGYYRQHLFEPDGQPKSFAIQPRMQLMRLEMYNVAEAITLGVLLRDEVAGAFDLAQELAGRLVSRYQLPAGYFVTRVYLGGLQHTLPFLRWPQSQSFYALTNLLLALQSKPADDTKPGSEPALARPVSSRS